jgi:dTDP-4-amino-4,6-dideoxygalactose transaminase
VFHQYVVGCDARDELRAHLEAQGVGTGIHYPVAIHRSEAYASAGLGEGSLPVAERLASRSCSLPMHPSLTDEEIARVAGAVRSFAAAR